MPTETGPRRCSSGSVQTFRIPRLAKALRRARWWRSFPALTVRVRLLYDYTRYVARGFAPECVVPFRADRGGPALTETEMLGIVIGAAALSVAIALIDADMRVVAPADRRIP